MIALRADRGEGDGHLPVPWPRMPGPLPDIAIDMARAFATEDPDRAPPVLGAEVESRRPSIARARARPALLVAVSATAHALALALALLVAPAKEVPVNAGDEVIEVEMVLAEAATETQPSEASPTVTPEPASEQPPQKEPPPPEPPPEAPDAEPIPATIPQPQPPAPPPAPPAVATQEVHAATDASYGRLVARHLAKFKRFPPGLGRGFKGGRVVVRFTLAPDGLVRAADVEASSGNAALDSEALETVRRAAPFPARRQASGGDVSFVVPITYRLQDR